MRTFKIHVFAMDDTRYLMLAREASDDTSLVHESNGYGSVPLKGNPKKILADAKALDTQSDFFLHVPGPMISTDTSLGEIGYSAHGSDHGTHQAKICSYSSFGGLRRGLCGPDGTGT